MELAYFTQTKKDAAGFSYSAILYCCQRFIMAKDFTFFCYRTLNCMVGQMKHILATEQKKTDFKPEDENNVMIQYTTVRRTRP